MAANDSAKGRTSAKGYTNVILLLNMKDFIHEQDQGKFERLRGAESFSRAIREVWPQKLADQKTFITIEEEKRRRGQPDEMTTEQVGFATGVFRSLILERYTFPAYALDKETVTFNQDLETNFQFKTIFLRAWNSWSIYIRPTFTGFFVIRFTHRHLERPRAFIRLVQDVLLLQESFDIKRAQSWLQEDHTHPEVDSEEFARRSRSVKAFLEWLGADETYAGNLLYYPLQWRLAMQVCSLFIEALGTHIPIDRETDRIRLRAPKRHLSVPPDHSYVVHHFTELLASESLVRKSKSMRSKQRPAKDTVQLSVDLMDIRKSIPIRKALFNLIMGTVLKPFEDYNLTDTLKFIGHSFPGYRWSNEDDLLSQNQAPLSDELCLLTSRSAIIMPSQKWREHELSVSSVPGSSLHVPYPRYWDAIERAIEFVLEVNALVHDLESKSNSLLNEISGGFDTSNTVEAKLFTPSRILSELISSSVHLRRVAGLCQEMSNPRLWSSTETSIALITNLLDQLRVSASLKNVNENVDGLSNYLDLYLAEISERESRKLDLRSLALAAASLTLTFLMLPSFYADAWQLALNLRNQFNLPINILVIVGTLLAAGLLVSSITLLSWSWRSKE